MSLKSDQLEVGGSVVIYFKLVEYPISMPEFIILSIMPGPSSLVAIPAIAWATSLNRTTVARAIAGAIATALRSVTAAIANKCVMRNFDQSNCEFPD